MKGLNMGAVETVATMVTAAIGGFIGAAIYRMIRRKRWPHPRRRSATARYNREKTKVFQLRFYASDMDLYERIQQQPNKQGCVKSLIRADMERY
jgi:uncharacterized protein YcfJ